MTREDSIRLKTWVTNDGRYLTADEITPEHLAKIRDMLSHELTAGYDVTAGQKLAAEFVAKHEHVGNYADYVEMDHDAYRAAWLQIIDMEFERRAA